MRKNKTKKEEEDQGDKQEENEEEEVEEENYKDGNKKRRITRMGRKPEVGDDGGQGKRNNSEISCQSYLMS